MGLVEIRETIEQSIDLNPIAGGGNLGIAQKRINLKPGQRFTMMSVDFMDDTFLLPQDISFAYEVMVSPYPVIPTSMLLAENFLGRGPCGADDSLLFKQIGLSNLTHGVQAIQRMPNDFLGAMPTYSWYTPHLYITVFLHSIDGAPPSTIETAISVYMSVKETTVNDIEYGIGIIREYDNAQTKARMKNGLDLENALSLVGQTYPMWRAGGIRSERMIKANSNASWFLSGFSLGAEETLSGTEIRGFISQSREMVGNTEAFGTRAADLGGIPDWIRFMEYQPINFGDERSQFPPHVVDDNGNTRMV